MADAMLEELIDLGFLFVEALFIYSCPTKNVEYHYSKNRVEQIYCKYAEFGYKTMMGRTNANEATNDHTISAVKSTHRIVMMAACNYQIRNLPNKRHLLGGGYEKSGVIIYSSTTTYILGSHIF